MRLSFARAGARKGTALALLASAWVASAGCAYVTRAEYLEEWDEDGDGWPLDQDCAPQDPNVYPGAVDLRGDGCDTDCGLETDTDGDDWPDDADCAPNDPTIYPCSPNEDGLDDVDDDCDAKPTKRTDTCPGLDPDFPEAAPPPCGGTS